MTRSVSTPLLLLVLMAAACASGGTGIPDDDRGYLRLLDVEPEIGARVEDPTIRVRAAYRLPPGREQYRANLMFVTQSGGLMSASGARPVHLEDREGVVELTAVPPNVRTALRSPLTAIVMIMGQPGEMVTRDEDDLPASLRTRLDQARDSAAGSADSLRVRIRSAPIRPVLRSRAIFYNGAGPAAVSMGPALPFAEVMAEYGTYGGAKALALAVDENGRRTWGYGFGFRAAAAAIERAMQECERGVTRRSMEATCQLYAVGDSILAR